MRVPVYESVRVKRAGADNGCSFPLCGYDRVLMCECDECGTEYIDVIDTDPGSIEEAIGVRTLCDPCWDNSEVDKFV